jgi:UrcA family protein
MSSATAKRPLVLVMVGLGSVLALGQVAVGEESPAIGEITVQSTRYAVRSATPTKQQAGVTESGIPITQVEIIHHVRFDDLDLKTDVGAEELRKRVADVATRGCKSLDGFDPGLTTDRECVLAAVKAARQQVEAAIAEARRAG